MRKRRTNDARLGLQLAMMLWAYEHQPVSVSEVAEHFGIDPDDAYSELYPLQGIEVEVNKEFHNLGVVVDDDGEIFFDLNPFFGRPRRLERSEALGLLAAANAALGLPGTNVAALKTAVEKLEHALGVGPSVAIDMQDPEFLKVIEYATRNRECIHIEYYARWTDEILTRMVEPYETINVSGDWYLRAHCRLRDDHRTFRIDRIEGVELTGEIHSRSDPGNEAFTGGEKAPMVTIKMPNSSRWMIEPLQASVKDDGDDLIVEMSVSSTIFLELLMLRLGPAARVVGRGPFSDVASLAAQRLLSRYETS
ncbi:MAG: hypothetical protein MB55_03655 [marine actinobacterium MedAcidi-G3]|nr:MAG: hypothetical protein MB55_03655 [marine actinobacterium MedAcidi-G3]HCJ86169.1 WYL domain-containing protein [Acidimicrobiaceae bacterium]|tara:strand:- start:2739 stop:3662 length:924 start_codon:yes stop_codon:yes gene_type:complete